MSYFYFLTFKAIGTINVKKKYLRDFSFSPFLAIFRKIISREFICPAKASVSISVQDSLAEIHACANKQVTPNNLTRKYAWIYGNFRRMDFRDAFG